MSGLPKTSQNVVRSANQEDGMEWSLFRDPKTQVKVSAILQKLLKVSEWNPGAASTE
jgi:hypothetical protein